MCSRRHGEVVLEVRRLQKTDISSYQQKEQAHHSSAVLLPHVRLFRCAVGDKFVFWTTTQHVIEHSLFNSRQRGYSTSRMASAFSRLNSIENVWEVAGRNYPPTNKNTPHPLPQQLLDNAVQSMVRRVECCITLHGGHIPY
ncbi:hypothetical protein TNCV_1051781 [Trichonephila clavipes]|nr:hypothetical protein TNCV_1051781 [Trichonephila clavipes]